MFDKTETLKTLERVKKLIEEDNFSGIISLIWKEENGVNNHIAHVKAGIDMMAINREFADLSVKKWLKDNTRVKFLG